jgi:hypothetical protein
MMPRSWPWHPGLVLIGALALAACQSEGGPVSEDAAVEDAAVLDAAAPDSTAPDAQAADAQGSDAADAAGTADAADATAKDAAVSDLVADLYTGDGDMGASGGTITVLSYNIAGLPLGLSKSDPYINTPLISPLLNNYNLALMQEDFAFTKQLSSAAKHPYKSTPGTPAPGTFMNDGLTRFSWYKFTNHKRHKWQQCHGILDAGSDCLASKGFSVAETHLAAGVTIDVYNLHMDAGQASADLKVRATQVDQLLKEIASRSAGRAIIVAGDTNIKPSKSTENKQMLAKLMTQAGLTDACVAVSCGDTDRIDRVMYRSSTTVQLKAQSWKLDAKFVDSKGNDLSDHEAVGVTLSWKVLAPGGG